MSVTRRGFFQGLGAGAALSAAAVRATPASAQARAAFSPLVGGRFGEALVESAEVHLGAIAILCRADDGQRFQIDVLRSGEGPSGVRVENGLSFYLANRGDGRSPSHEGHGRTLLGIADWYAEHGSAQVPELLSWSERAEAHPRGAFLVG